MFTCDLERNYRRGGYLQSIMTFRNVFLVLTLLGVRAAAGQSPSPPVSGMHVVGIYASKPGDTTLYCLLGGGACLDLKDAGTADHYIAQWLAAHATATVIPVSSQTQTAPNSTKPATPARNHEVYVWIADGTDILNVALVREGYYDSRSMLDMVESEQLEIEREKKIDAENHVPGFLDTMNKMREATPKEDRPRRLVSDGDYAVRMKQMADAEQDARQAKRGIWAGGPHAEASDVSLQSRESFSVHDLYVHGVNAHRLGDADVYCLVGGEFCVSQLGPTTHEDQVAFVSNWLSMHPSATAIPVSTESRKIRRDQPPVHSTYVWIADGKDSLNLDLVRNGYCRAQALADMVEFREQFDDSLKAPALSATRAMLAQEQADELAPTRLIPDRDYKSKMEQAAAAEQYASNAQLGLWSPAVIVHWKAPSDASMIEVFSKHPDWFRQISDLAHEDARLTGILRTPESIAQARNSDIPRAKVDAYVALLEKLDVNETITDVVGLGQLSLVKADIIFGLFDNGIIKGYVYGPLNPNPIVKDLENRPPELSNENTAYRPLGNGWYLFEMLH